MSSESESVSKLSQNQQNSVADDSVSSNLNCRATVESSDDDQIPSMQNTQSTSSTSSTLGGGSALLDVTTQQVINVQILAQLSSISARLNILEKKGAKKGFGPKKRKSAVKQKTCGQVALVILPQPQCPTLTMSSLQSIRQDVLIQSQVGQRLKELLQSDNTGTNIKSLRGGPAEVVVPNQIKWPQEFVLSGFKKERVQYDQLSIVGGWLLSHDKAGTGCS